MKKTILLCTILSIVLNLSAQKNVFEENFKNKKNKWVLNGKLHKDSATLNIAQNQLVLDNKRIGSTISLIEIPNKKINIYTDEEVTISGTAKHLSGTKINAYGILIGEKLPDNKFNGYFFTIVDSGFYRMYYFKDGKQGIYKNWTKSESINQNNAENVLTIVKKRNQFHFLINGQWLFNIANEIITTINSLGVTVNQNQKVAFTNLKIESFTKITDKKEQDKINDLTSIMQQSQNGFKKASSVNPDQFGGLVTWLPYMNEDNKNINLVTYGYFNNQYYDNCSYEKAEAENRVKQYTKYIEKVLGKFEKIEKPNVLGKKTYWLSKNPNHKEGTFIMLDEYKLSANYYVKFIVEIDKDINKEKIEKMKD